MHCPTCSFDNPQGSVYCQQCGARLPAQGPVPTDFGGGGVVAAAPAPVAAPEAVPSAAAGGAGRPCGRCGAANAPHMRFCVQCGNALEPDLAAAPAPPAPAPMAPAAAAPAPMAPAAAPMPVAPAAAPMPVAPAAAPPAGGAAVHTMTDAPQPVVQAAPAALVAILKDGSDGRTYPLGSESTDLGRTEGDVVLGDDPYLSNRHARVTLRGGTWVIRDLDSVNGIYVRIREPVEVRDGDMILIGQQVLRFEVLSDGELPLGPATIQGVLTFGTPEVPRLARLVQYTTEGVGRDVHYLYREETVLGRENGDIVFTDDPFLSRRHAAITTDRAAHRTMLRDLGSSNGTSLRFRGERSLSNGDQFRVGRHLFRFDEPAGRGAS